MTYRHAVLGGTFDRLHKGHEAMLTRAFQVAEHVTIGLTTDTYVRTRKQHLCTSIDEETISGVACPSVSLLKIASYTMRKKHLDAWIEKQGYGSRTAIMPIDDMVGPTAAPGYDFDALVVSTETEKNAEILQGERKANGLAPLAVVAVPMVPAEDLYPISSSRVRIGVIDATGRLTMPERMRGALVKPFGALMSDGNTESVMRGDIKKTVISVGDKTTKRLMQNGVIPTLAIVDLQVERKAYTWEKEDWDMLPKAKTELPSGPGFISTLAAAAISAWAKHVHPSVLIIDGEEDLLVLPAIVHAPLGAIVYYGQPKKGIVRLVVTNAKKEEAAALLGQFT